MNRLIPAGGPHGRRPHPAAVVVSHRIVRTGKDRRYEYQHTVIGFNTDLALRAEMANYKYVAIDFTDGVMTFIGCGPKYMGSDAHRLHVNGSSKISRQFGIPTHRIPFLKPGRYVPEFLAPGTFCIQVP